LHCVFHRKNSLENNNDTDVVIINDIGVIFKRKLTMKLTTYLFQAKVNNAEPNPLHASQPAFQRLVLHNKVEEDSFLQYSTFSFDASVYDVFGSMMSGSQLHLLSNEQRFSIESFTPENR
jgi:hypothetical protein